MLNFGAYDLTGFLPQAHHFDKPLILNYDTMKKFQEAFLPNTDEAARRDPAVSPFYADLKKITVQSKHDTLPPALFTCGTEDCLLEDTMFMSTKWMMAGADARVKLYPGAPHAFILFSPDISDAAAEAYVDVKEFLLEKSASRM